MTHFTKKDVRNSNKMKTDGNEAIGKKKKSNLPSMCCKSLYIKSLLTVMVENKSHHNLDYTIPFRCCVAHR